MPTSRRNAAAALLLSPAGTWALAPFIRLAPRRAFRLGSSPSPADRPGPLEHGEAYPDLEFVNYEEGEGVEWGDGDDLFPRMGSDADTDREVEEMRETQRVQNDVFQFNTYHQKFLEGREWQGEWTVYRTSTFMEGFEDVVDENGAPRLMRSDPLRAISTGTKIVTDASLPDYGGAHIRHSECYVPDPSDDETDSDTAPGEEPAPFWPAELDVYGFRGPQGNMFVGPAYTLCDADLVTGCTAPEVRVPHAMLGEVHAGPFSGLRSEVGIADGDVRMRVKLDYRVMPDEGPRPHPQLRLASLTVCREADGRWPGAEDRCFTGEAGARGGLHDPPPLGGAEQEAQYMMLELEGFATCLFPHTIDQDPEAHDGRGWVATLDWAPGDMRYQADRKFVGGAGLKGLRSLELTEIQSKNAEQYKPQKGPQDMFRV